MERVGFVGGGGLSVNKRPTKRVCGRVRMVSETLKKDLQSEKKKDRLLAVIALRQEDKLEAKDLLIESGVLNDSIEQVRVAAHVALGRCGAPDVVPLLLKAMQGDKDQGVRAAAAEALTDVDGVSQNEPVLDALIDRWENDRDYIVKFSAITSMGLLGNMRALDTISKILSGDEPEDLFVGAAINAIADLAPAEEKYLDLVLSRAGSSEPIVRRSVANTLGVYSHNPKALEALHTLSREKGQAVFVHDAALESLRAVERRMGL